MRKRVESIRIPAWFFVLVTLVYYELMLRLMVGSPFDLRRSLCVLLFTGGFTLFSAWLSSLPKKKKHGRTIAWILVIVWGVVYLTMYFVRDAFRSFMSPKTILAGAGGIATGFLGTTVKLVISEFWRILVFAIPSALYILLRRTVRRRPPLLYIRRYLIIGCGCFLTLALLFVFLVSPDQKKFWKEYNFDTAVHSFGLRTAFCLEIFRGSSLESTGFEQVNISLPTEKTEKPVETTADPTAPPVPTETTEPTEPTEPPKEFNKLDIDFEALKAQTDSDKIKDVHDYVASLQPSKTNEYTGLFKGKNLILITAEAFSLEVIDEELTPALYRLANKGIKFTDYYQPDWNGSTSTGEFSNIVGLIPVNGVRSVTDTVGKNMYMTMGNSLMRLGYFSRAFHNHTYNFYDRDKTHENLGYEKYIGYGNGLEDGIKYVWPESDKQMIDYTVPMYIDQQPFSIYYMTVSGHCSYSRNDNTMSYWNYEVVKDLPYSERVKCYLAANMELEYAMEDLLQQLEEAGIADDTVIVMGADHYPYGLEKSATWKNDEDYLSELYGFKVKDCFDQDHNALIIWSGCIEDKNIVVDTPTYSLDILPTLSNLFGLDYDSRLLVGRDVFSDTIPLVLWPNHSWITTLGKYNAKTGDFTPKDGAIIPEGYEDFIAALVRNKFSFSDAVLKYDYYNILFPK